MTRTISWRVVLAVGLSTGCAAEDGKGDPMQQGGQTESESDSSVGASSGQTSTDTNDPMASTGEDEGDETEGGTDDGVSFIVDPDGGGFFECDIWAQDCLEGEKCMPFANDGGNAWNATRCSALDPTPGQPGDACIVEGSGVSGVDNCDVSAMCWDVDPETNEGTCVAFCTGSRESPVCDDPDSACSITNGGTLILCLQACDPLLQDCADGQGCYGIDLSFVCAPDASGEPGLYGDPCEFINACDPGLACVSAPGVPGCTGSSGCCSSFCDVDDPASSAACGGAASGQECVSWFEEGNAPPGYESAGVCFVPA